MTIRAISLKIAINNTFQDYYLQDCEAKQVLTGERRIKLLETIENKQFISVSQLSEIFKVHETTIRRDLDELESQGLVVRIHGGVVPASIKQDEPVFEDRATEKITEKIRIGKYAAKFINSGEAVILDSGTTTLQIAKTLNEMSHLQDVTIITNDVNIASVLRSNRTITTIVTGGTLFHDSYMLNGQIANESLQQFSVDKAFIATPALNIEKGLTHFNELLITTKRNMIAAAAKKIVVTDHTKIGRRALYTFLPINKIDLLITDDQTDIKLIEEMYKNGIKRIESI
ncbi:DeoR/GlpR family DNA-binding transcription regulator [Enterococcus pseudoavium]|uniref:DeoR/GlpR family DNA-binding transcription regulator n=1 Tax=Enterococcus pseudoavium TaxID=44007 RepID=A0AAE4I2F5_9ENTE|nr:DeoR/GlpR family DNA-binding transcription regulator [Enterococcus pseudoavium]MDT2737308.1 DeoR/GlpR family DNA-binding transcription regulator [Enterococcus pseudoavium]